MTSQSADAIIPQMQPTPWSCVHTCIAMILGVPAQEIIDRFPRDQGMSELETLVALQNLDVMHAPTLFGKLWLGWQLVAVPSLNVEGGLHQILVHWYPGEGYRVVDPSPLKRYQEDGSDLNSWSAVILVRLPADRSANTDSIA